MREYSFMADKEIKFKFSDKKGLCIEVNDGEKSFGMEFCDSVFDKRITHDGASYEKHCSYNTYHSDVNVKEDKNSITIISNPKDIESGEILSDITVTNIFTFSEGNALITQKTFFNEEKTVYDRAFFAARMKVVGGDFKKIECERINAGFDMEETESCIAYPKELTIKGEKCYFKLKGGYVSFQSGSFDAHYDSLRYNDCLSYINEENPLYTMYSFSEDISFELPTLPSVKKYEDGEIQKIESGKLSFELSFKKDSAAFLFEGKRRPFIAMLLKNTKSGEEIFADTLSDWENVSYTRENDNIRILLENPYSGSIKGIALEIKGVISENKIEWETKVNNYSELYSLIWCTYPRFYGKAEKESTLFTPEHSGTVESGFGETDRYAGGTYPSGFYVTMPYYAIYSEKGGFYYSVHDKDGSYKEFYVASTQKGDVRFSSRFYAEEYGKAKNTNALPGKMVWQAFEGDWYDAANIYRSFVKKDAYWFKEEENPKSPEWMSEVPLWLMDWVPYDPDSGEILPTNLRQDKDVVGENDWYENPIKIQKALGTPIAYHVYNWHSIPFNNDYPHFMPARKRFTDGLKEMKKYDIKVMPYINALLWDTRDKGCEDYMFTKVAKKGAVKKENGEVQLLTYESREKDGKRVMLAPMCPSYKPWREFLVNLTSEMFEKLDIDAIYLDQISARVPFRCMDKSHSHPVGGGSWWGKEYNELIKELNKHKPEGKGFTSESNAEVYAGTLDGFLSWAWIQSGKDVPAFMRVYSEKINVFGRNANGFMKLNDLHWKYHFAMALVSGQQPGWINADFVKNEKRLEFIKKLARFRYENKEFFKFPEVLRPAKIEDNGDNFFKSAIGMKSSGILHRPYLCTGTMEKNGKKMMVIVNIADCDITDTLSFNEKEYNLKNYTVSGYGKIESIEDGKLSVTVEKESFFAIEW